MKSIFTIMALFSVCFCINSAGATTFVVLKGNPAKQSTKYTASENPVLGNDGNTSGTYIAGVQCVAWQGGDPLPWWMVDMQLTYNIYGARVWNRLDGLVPQRFTQISIGITSNPSVWTNFSTSLFNLCMYYRGVPTAAMNPINFACSTPIAGRYLAVYKNNTGLSNLYFHFCEIDILAISDKTQISFTGHKVQPSFSSTLSSQSFNSSSVLARSDVECVLLCADSVSCVFILFNSAGLQCWLLETYVLPISFQTVLSDGASFLIVS